MKKKVISFMLSLTLLFSLTALYPTANAVTQASSSDSQTPAGTPISTVSDFLAMDPNGSYYLTNDLDFSGKTYNQNVYTKSFRGVLDGNGYALLGITVRAANSDAGIFANNLSGVIKNLSIGSEASFASISSTGSSYSVGALAGTVSSGATFENLRLYVNVRGDGKTAGFTSYLSQGFLTIKACEVYGSVSGNPAAGFVTMSHDGSSNITITNSFNYAAVTGGNLGAGGFYSTHSMTNSSRVCHLVLAGCGNFGAVTASDWRVGGIVGEFNESPASTLQIDYCYNVAPITMTGSGGFAGGIVGGMCFDAPTGARTITNVYNTGLVRNKENASRAYAIAFAHSQSNLNTVQNAAYLEGTPTSNTRNTNVKQASDAASLLEIVSAFEKKDGLAFVKDSTNSNNGFPILSIQSNLHENVQTFACGRAICLDCGARLSAEADENHNRTESTLAPSGYNDGYITATCRHCSDVVIRPGEKSRWHVEPVNGIYTMKSADDLMWYAANLNSGLLKGTEHLLLAADLDMKDKPYIPAASGPNAFKGSLDGQGHTIRNLTVKDAEIGGLFAKVGSGASIQNLAIDAASISSVEHAGTLAGTAETGSVVKLENIAVTASAVTSAEGAAGGIMGSSQGAADVTIQCAVCDFVTVTGKTAAGGVLGNGDSATLEVVFVNAFIEAPAKSTGSLACHGAAFSQKNCGYVRNGITAYTDGTMCSKEAFSSGELAYLVNTYGKRSVFGIQDGKTTITPHAMAMVRLGSQKIYTDRRLSAYGDTTLYLIGENGSYTLVFLHKRSAEKRLVDSTITVNGESIPFSSLTLSRYVSDKNNYYVAADDYALYKLAVKSDTPPAVTLNGIALPSTALS